MVNRHVQPKGKQKINKEGDQRRMKNEKEGRKEGSIDPSKPDVIQTAVKIFVLFLLCFY